MCSFKRFLSTGLNYSAPPSSESRGILGYFERILFTSYATRRRDRYCRWIVRAPTGCRARHSAAQNCPISSFAPCQSPTNSLFPLWECAAPIRHGSPRGVLASTFLIAGYPESNPQSHPIHLRSRWLIWIAPVPRIITATFVMCGSVACNATKSGSSSGPRKKNLTPEQEQRVWGDSSTGTAIDADTKFCVTHYFSDRSGAAAHEFMQDCAERIVGRPRITRTRIGRRLYLLGRNNFLQRLQAS